MLHSRASCSDKSLQWVDNVFHDLMHEVGCCTLTPN